MSSPLSRGHFSLHFEKRDLHLRKGIVQIVQFYYRCRESGQEFTATEIDHINVIQFHDHFSKKYSVLLGKQFSELRHALKKLSAVLTRNPEASTQLTDANKELADAHKNLENIVSELIGRKKRPPTTLAEKIDTLAQLKQSIILLTYLIEKKQDALF